MCGSVDVYGGRHCTLFLHFDSWAIKMCYLCRSKVKAFNLLLNIYSKTKLSKIHTEQLCRVLCSVAQSCLALCDPMDYGPPSSSVHGIFQARTLEWVAISFSRGSSCPRDWTCIFWVSCIDREILYHCATWEAYIVLVNNFYTTVLFHLPAFSFLYYCYILYVIPTYFINPLIWYYHILFKFKIL